MSLERITGRLDSLDVETRAKALLLLAVASDQGIPVRVTQAHRSLDEQTALFAQGRQPLAEVNVLREKLGWLAMPEYDNIKVTRAKAGESWHNFHRAFDVVPMSGGTPDWLSVFWERLGKLGEEVGLEWGGRFPHPDKPHFQNPQGQTLAEAKAQDV